MQGKQLHPALTNQNGSHWYSSQPCLPLGESWIHSDEAQLPNISPPSSGRICGVIGTCLYAATKIVDRLKSPFNSSSLKPFWRFVEHNVYLWKRRICKTGGREWRFGRCWILGFTKFIRRCIFLRKDFVQYQTVTENDMRDLVLTLEDAVNTPYSDFMYSFNDGCNLDRNKIAAVSAFECQRTIKEVNSHAQNPFTDETADNERWFHAERWFGWPIRSQELHVAKLPAIVGRRYAMWSRTLWTEQLATRMHFEWKSWIWSDELSTAKLSFPMGRSFYAFRIGTWRRDNGRPTRPSSANRWIWREHQTIGTIADISLRSYLPPKGFEYSLSGRLNDVPKGVTEYWLDGPDGVTPAGHAFQITTDAALYEKLDSKETARLLFIVGNAVWDAAIASWRTKTIFDYSRPLQMIQCGAAGE